MNEITYIIIFILVVMLVVLGYKKLSLIDSKEIKKRRILKKLYKNKGKELIRGEKNSTKKHLTNKELRHNLKDPKEKDNLKTFLKWEWKWFYR